MQPFWRRWGAVIGKRSSFDRVPRDYYPTPYSCIPALLPHLAPRTRFVEPCAGDGRLIGYLQEHGHVCESASDIEPGDPCIKRQDALQWLPSAGYEDQTIITNPPWDRKLLHPLIRRFSGYHPTWLLFDLPWAATEKRHFVKYSSPIEKSPSMPASVNFVSELDDSLEWE